MLRHHKERETQNKRKCLWTRYSQAVSHPSTDQARPCLASEIRRDRALSGWCGLRLGRLSPRSPMSMRLYSPACQGAQESTAHYQQLWQIGGSGGRAATALVVLLREGLRAPSHNAHVGGERRASLPPWKMLLGRWRPGNSEFRTWNLGLVSMPGGKLGVWGR